MVTCGHSSVRNEGWENSARPQTIGEDDVAEMRRVLQEFLYGASSFGVAEE